MIKDLEKIYLEKYRLRGNGGVEKMANDIGICIDTLRRFLNQKHKKFNIRTRPIIRDFIENYYKEKSHEMC
jgi:hypothetical protein